MGKETEGRVSPEPGKRLPLPESVQQARAALAQAVEHLREFQADRRYPQVTRNEAEGVVTAIRAADALAAKLDPPFLES